MMWCSQHALLLLLPPETKPKVMLGFNIKYKPDTHNIKLFEWRELNLLKKLNKILIQINKVVK